MRCADGGTNRCRPVGPRSMRSCRKAADAAVRAEADVMALVFGDKAAAEALRRVAASPASDSTRRQEALAALVEVRAPDLAGLLQKLVEDPAMRDRALQGLAAYDDPQTPQVILGVYNRLDAAEKHDAMETLSSRPAYAMALLEAVESSQGSCRRHFGLHRAATPAIQRQEDFRKTWQGMGKSARVVGRQERAIGSLHVAADARFSQESRSLTRPADFQPHLHAMPYALRRRR